MTKTVYFVRHGQSEANVQGILAGHGNDSPLTDLGRSQATEIAHSLKSVRFDILVSSPASRAQETAKIIISELGLPAQDIVLVSDFIERDAGEFTGKPKKDYLAFVAAGGEAGESNEAMVQRVSRGLNWLREQDFENALVVTHNGTTQMIRVITEGLPASKFFDLPQLDNGQFLKIEL